MDSVRSSLVYLAMICCQVVSSGSSAEAASGTLNIYTEPPGAKYYVFSIGVESHCSQIVHSGSTNYFDPAFPKGDYGLCVEKEGYETLVKRVHVGTYQSAGIYNTLKATSEPQLKCLAYLQHEQLSSERKRQTRLPVPPHLDRDGEGTVERPHKAFYIGAERLNYRKATLGEYQKGTLLQFRGRVSQIVGDDGAMIYPAGVDDPVLLTFDSEPQLIEGDVCDIKGRYVSPTRYTTVLGAEKVVPLLVVDYYSSGKQR